ncbi:RNA-directed DNA polymerase, eukaryota, reverse transcriptase zinc-binding domain protein [Tanacetum coccineum]
MNENKRIMPTKIELTLEQLQQGVSNDVLVLPDVQVTALDRLWFDHNPILIHCNKLDYGLTPFRLYHSWFNRNGFDDLISVKWNSFGQNSDNHNLLSHDKLKGLKAKIKDWLKVTKTNERHHKQEALVALKNLKVKIDSNTASLEDRESCINLLHEIDKIGNLEALDLLQKSRTKWDIEGDENSKFFHCLVNQKRRNNSIHGIMDEGAWITNPHQILEKDVFMEEIKSAVWDCGNDKAPGPNGFTFGFIKHYWELIKFDIEMFVSKFLETKKMPMGSNSSFITHISKIKAFLESSRTSILVNGIPTSEFFVKRGLRQGDPFSPFLFMLVMEGLHTALMEVTNSGLICGINIGSLMLPYLTYFYVDDVVITTEWSSLDMDNIIRVLLVFYLASGLQINIPKSNVYGVGVSNNEVSTMTNNIGCSPDSFPFVYLGLPIGANMNLTVNRKILFDRFNARLSK